MKCPLCKSNDPLIEYYGETKVSKCVYCKLWFIPDKINEDYYFSYFNDFRANEVKRNRLRNKQYLIDAEHLYRYVKEGLLLDVGCSTGQFAREVNKKGQFEILGIDIDYNAIKIANTQIQERISFQHCKITDLNNKKLFNAIIFRGTFQYMGKHFQKNIRKIYSLLKPNGLVIIYCLPNSYSYIFHLVRENWWLFNPTEHKLIFNKESITFLANKYNFQILEFTFPYEDTAYANIRKDYQATIDIITKKTKSSPPFWGNIMQIVLKK